MQGNAMRHPSRIFFLFSCVAALTSGAAFAQSVNFPPGYFDIPAGFDFPAQKATLEQYISSGNVSAERLHTWNVFAGMTQATPDGKFAIFETWYSEPETFDASAAVAALTLRPARLPRFQVPRQFLPPKGLATPAVAGQSVLSFVLYNFAAFNHVRSNGLFKASTLDNLLKNGSPNPSFPKDRDIPAFPANAISLKTVWWPIAKDRATAMPIWDPDQNPASPSGNPPTTWARYVAVDPTRTNIPPDEFADVPFNGQPKHVHVVGSDKIHLVEVTADQASGVNSDGLLAQVAQAALGRPLQAGDFAALVATHLTTKEIDNWVWATFWWHDQPDKGPFAADRPGLVTGGWRNYLMNVSYDLNLPRETDGTPHVAFNPWLEARFVDGGHGGGVVSNCMNCHNRASYPDMPFLPVYRGSPDPQDKAFDPGRLRTDFLWSVPDQAQ
jgi:hypothetical protein